MLARPALLALVTALPWCGACASLDKADECRQVARLANPVLSEIERDRVVVKSPTYRAIAKKYEGLALAVGQVKIQSKHVAEAVDDYQRLFHEAARDARAFADALDARDETRILVVRASATRTVRHEATALSHFDLVCRIGH